MNRRQPSIRGYCLRKLAGTSDHVFRIHVFRNFGCWIGHEAERPNFHSPLAVFGQTQVHSPWQLDIRYYHGSFEGKMVHTWWIFQCHVWWPEGKLFYVCLEILSGHARINPLFQRRINVASDARQRLRNSVRQHWLWLSVSSKTRPGVH